MIRRGSCVNTWCACLGILLMMAGCSNKQVATSVQDQAFMSGSIGNSDEIRVTDFSGPVSTTASRGSDGAADAAASAMSAARAARLAAVSASLADVYFDYDRSTLNEEGRAKLEANARLLREEQDWQLVITGHCDERGSQDYNLVLGERRVQAVQRYLSDLGISMSKVQLASYGKEKPFCTKSNEDCWRQNRRAHFAMR
ncbi:MAG: peptidoglycan-associated lipoprotein [Nitrospirae bacterium]|nr:MAG: peptidoglycan-associated lipoprotein [Nitrospirota bacterium]